MLSTSAIQYTWDQIFYRLGIEISGNTFQLGKKNIRFSYGQTQVPKKDDADFDIIISSAGEQAFDDLISGRTQALIRLPQNQFLPSSAYDFPVRELPILFWGEDQDGQLFAEIHDKQLIVHADILAAIFFMLSRYEEVNSTEKDSHGRFPFAASVCSKHDLIDIPIVDFYCVVLKYWIEALTGQTLPNPHQFKVSFSHDIDYLFLSHPFHKGLLAILKDLLKLKFDYLIQDIAMLFSGYEHDLYYRDMQRLAAIARENGNKDVFFMLPADSCYASDGYPLKDKKVHAAIEYLKANNAEIGYHASYKAYDDPQRYRAEKQALDDARGNACTHARHHYLRIRTPQTWRNLQNAGIKVDESYSFSEHEGFRYGTCFPYKVFDIQQDRELDLIERPLIAMDASLKIYRKLTWEEAEASILRLAEYCQFVNGTFTLLWHNTSVSRDWDAWGKHLPHIVQTLTQISHQVQ